jgi:radical SAM superfamily enzyme YgiQ (UPF0313 family)
MRILLIDPPFYRLIGYYNRYFPLGLASLAAVVKSKGHEALVLDSDANISPDKMNFAGLEQTYPDYLREVRSGTHQAFADIRRILTEFKPDIIGISVWTTYVASSIKTAEICKEWNPSVPVIMGGPHVSIKAEELINICGAADVLVRGEGEAAIVELMDFFCSGADREAGLAGIKGITYRSKDGIKSTPDRLFVGELDTLPFPARDAMVHKDSYDCEDMGLIMATRGCPYGCTYCATSIWGRKVRYRSIPNVIAEIKEVITRYGTKQFAFKDDSFTINKAYTLEFCEALLREKLDIKWECNARVDSIDLPLLLKMKEAGCNSIKVGVETGSERLLGLINKGITHDQCRKAARDFKESGIFWTAYFMIGLPGETREEMYKTLDFMRELGPDFSSLSVYEPFPATKLYDIGLEKGLVTDVRNKEDYFSISPKYYYVKDLGRRIDTMPQPEFDAVEADIKAAFRKYNLAFPRLAKRGLSRVGVYLDRPAILGRDIKKFFAYLK